MADLLELLHVLVHDVTVALGYPGIFLLMLAENLFPPIPSEVVMPFAGFMVSEGEMTFLGILLAGTLGSGAGAALLYLLGARLGRKRVEAIIDRYGKYLLLSRCDLERSLALFNRHGKPVVLLGRLIPGVRSLISIPAGIQRMPVIMFAGYTLLGTLIWNVLLGGAGIILGRNWQRILQIVDSYEKVLYVLIAVVVLFFAARRLWALKRNGGFIQEEC